MSCPSLDFPEYLVSEFNWSFEYFLVVGLFDFSLTDCDLSRLAILHSSSRSRSMFLFPLFEFVSYIATVIVGSAILTGATGFEQYRSAYAVSPLGHLVEV